MDTKQKDILAWLGELEKYATDKQLSMRILDGIEDCKNKTGAESPDLQEISIRVEDLLSSIEQKTASVVVQDNNQDQIPIQAIEDQIKKMAQRCQTENKASVRNITERKNLVVKKIYENLQEITHTKAHLKDLKDQSAYLHFYENQRMEYERATFSLIRELLHDVSGNYNYMVEHLRSMFQSIGGYKFGVGNEKFYNEFETQKEGLDNRLQNEVVSKEVGGSKITDFAQKTEKKIKKTVSKFVRVRKLLAWVPVIVLLLVLTAGFVVKQNNQQDTTEETQEQSSWVSDLASWASDFAKEKVSQNTSSSETDLSFLIFIVLIVIVLYCAYIGVLKSWCNRRICTVCGEYLQVELEDFKRSDSIMPMLNDAVDSSILEYEQEYLAILHQILFGSVFDADENEQSKMREFESLKESWNKIKYE